MATDGDAPRSSAAIAARLGRTPTGSRPTRDGLIKKGLVHALAHGQVAFTVPGMAASIARTAR